MSDSEIHTCACANCAWEGDVNDVAEVRNFWGRVEPGDTMPAGACPDCESLVYLVDVPPQGEPVVAHLNLSGGKGASDHLITLHLDIRRLEGLQAVARANDLDKVVVRPPFGLNPYSRGQAPPCTGFLGEEASGQLDGSEPAEFDANAEPTIRLDGLTLHLSGDGYCYAEGHAKHGDQVHQTEAFQLSDLRDWLTAQAQPALAVA